MQTRPLLRTVVVTGLFILLIVVGHWISVQVSGVLAMEMGGWGDMQTGGLFVSVILLYILLTAVPFVPGAELGFALILLLGTKVLVIVYCATISALLLAFGVGRLVSESQLARLFKHLGAHRIESLLVEFSQLDPQARVQYLTQRAPEKWIPVLLRHRFWTLALLINLPGNSLLGGGGGIALLAGISRMISVPQFIACICLAVAPVPLAVLLSAWAVPTYG